MAYTNVKPKKSLGQHFLKDANIARKISESLKNIDQDTTIIEVGPGMGILSGFLFEKYPKQSVLIEIDDESIAFLNSRFPEFKDKIIREDFLKFDFANIKTEKIAVIGNFPYNISSQILFRAIENRNRVVTFSGMFQREVAKRIVSPPGSKEYGILSVLAQAWFDCKYLFSVDEHLFVPPPKIKSGVICLIRKDNIKLDCNEDLFISVVKSAFNQRRKTLKNALSQYTNKKGAINSLFEKRAEQLKWEDFVNITQYFQD